MTSLSFFGSRDDHVTLLDFIIGDLECQVFEAYSQPNHELRTFATVAEVNETFDLETDPHGHGLAVQLMLWSAAVGGRPRVRRFPLRGRGATFRESVEGWGLVQLQLGGIHNGRLTSSRFAHNSETRARTWEAEKRDLGPVDAWSWDELQKVSSKLRYHIAKRLAVAKQDASPVLAGAEALHRAGYELVRV